MSEKDEKLAKLMKGGWSYRRYVTSGGGGGESGGDDSDTQTYILVDESGNEVPAVLVEEKTVFNATANDIREGMVAATDEGVVTGTKVIPGYNTIEGIRYIPAGGAFTIPNPNATIDYYDYTKLQAIFCVFNTTLPNSVGADKVSIDNGVYNVNSTEAITTVIKDHESKLINFGIVNNTDKPYVLRFFTYKEVL